MAETKTPPPELTTPIAPDPSDPHNWREIDRLRKLAEFEGREFDPSDPYNWKGIAAAHAGTPGTTPGTAGTTPANTTPDPNVTAPDATPGTADAVNQRNRALFSTISQAITAAGLSGLFSIDANGNPSGRLWDAITGGLDNEAAVMLWFEQQPEFQARFPVIGQLRTNGAGGGVGLIPTPGQVREYEARVGGAMRLAGLPSSFYEDPMYLQSFMAQNMSAVEIEERLGRSWELVRSTDPAVMEAFQDFFGIGGDAAMAAFFLDPDRTLATLERQARTAYTAGMGRTLGLNLDQAISDRIAGLPSTEGGIYEDLTTVSAMERPGGVFTEGFTETADLEAETTGIDAVVFGSGDATAAIERRILERQANERSSLGGAAVTAAGAVGLSV